MKQLVKIIAFMMIVLSITIIKAPSEILTSEQQSRAQDLADSENESEENPVETELYEVEYYFAARNGLINPEVENHYFVDDYPTFLSSYTFTFYVPPLELLQS